MDPQIQGKTQSAATAEIRPAIHLPQSNQPILLDIAAYTYLYLPFSKQFALEFSCSGAKQLWRRLPSVLSCRQPSKHEASFSACFVSEADLGFEEMSLLHLQKVPASVGTGSFLTAVATKGVVLSLQIASTQVLWCEREAMVSRCTVDLCWRLCPLSCHRLGF